jgi:hypothetical protein
MSASQAMPWACHFAEIVKPLTIADQPDQAAAPGP